MYLFALAGFYWVSKITKFKFSRQITYLLSVFLSAFKDFAARKQKTKQFNFSSKNMYLFSSPLLGILLAENNKKV